MGHLYNRFICKKLIEGIYEYVYIYMNHLGKTFPFKGVSLNGDTPKLMLYEGKSPSIEMDDNYKVVPPPQL